MQSTLNAICPYYTMYPLDFPLRVLGGKGLESGWVVDPFCGRGTTNFAARLLGLPTLGFDSSPVAVAIAKAKLTATSAGDVVRAAHRILVAGDATETPKGEFWRLAYHRETLNDLCRLRAALLRDCRSDARILLRALVLGALHGPLTRGPASYFSNQSPRSFAPKPGYAVRFWREKGLLPPPVDTLGLIRRRAERYLAASIQEVAGYIALKDSRGLELPAEVHPRWIVTSPPYYGTRTYIPDQWLRYWFLGGPPHVEYAQRSKDLSHASPGDFTSDLRSVWSRLALFAHEDATLAVRFGSIGDRAVDPRQILRDSLRGTGWQLTTILRAGDAADGKRQARQFQRVTGQPRCEYDFYAKLA